MMSWGREGLGVTVGPADHHHGTSHGLSYTLMTTRPWPFKVETDTIHSQGGNGPESAPRFELTGLTGSVVCLLLFQI